MLNSMRAALISAEARSYGAFTDAQTGEIKPGGVAYRLWLCESFEMAPIEVRCTPDEFMGACNLGAGALVDVLVDVRANGNRLSLKLQTLTPASDNGVKAGK